MQIAECGNKARNILTRFLAGGGNQASISSFFAGHRVMRDDANQFHKLQFIRRFHGSTPSGCVGGTHSVNLGWLPFFLTALADGGFNRLLAFAFSPRLPAGATLAGLFLALSGVEGE